MSDQLNVDGRANSAVETAAFPANKRKSRTYFHKTEMPHRDRTGWLRTQSNANRSPPPIPC
jgi:hypothetical protein